jgi:hypothetical protein
MRYYAEWLDGEYLLLNRLRQGYDHHSVMQRAIRFHALFGSTLVLSDAQMIDIRNPVTTLFLDPSFRHFLKVRPDFLSLVAEPVRGTESESFAIAMKGIERLTNQANKPEDSFEMAITLLGEPIFHAGYFDAERYLNPGLNEKGRVGRIIRRYPRYSNELKGLLHVLDHFSRSPLPTTTLPSKGAPERYDNLLGSVQNDPQIVNEAKSARIREILRIQEQNLPEAQHGRRAAIRKLLGTGKWHDEEWTEENLRLYLDVVHAWNCAINRNIAPDAGTLYEAQNDIRLSQYERSVTDAVGWFSAKSMPTSQYSDPIRRLLSWDPLDVDWTFISKTVQQTAASAEDLQVALKTRDRKTWTHALGLHATEIANSLVNLPIKEIPEWCWTLIEAGVTLTDIFPSEYIEPAKEVVHVAPYLKAAAERKQIVNTVAHFGPDILNPSTDH